MFKNGCDGRWPTSEYFFAGISEYATTPGKASDYMYPLLSFAAEHIPKAKHQETPLYVLCTAGMRVLPERYFCSDPSVSCCE